jgi:hypothetical protein
MLDDVVLLWVVRRRVLMMHALSRTVVRELCHGELASAVSVKCLQFEAGLASARAWMSLMAATARSLEGITTTHMYLLRSSTSSRKYLLPLGVAGEIGPHKSPCTSSRRRSARYSTFARNEVRHCFPAWHASHNYPT